MKNKTLTILAVSVPFMIGWAFLFTTYYLTCESLKRFDNAEVRMTFPYNCEASINGNEYKNMNW